MNKQKLKIIDIGYQNLNLESALSLVESTRSKTVYEGEVRADKVITGHGSGKLRDSVRSWLDEQEGRFQAVIIGEEYHMFNKDASDMRVGPLAINDTKLFICLLYTGESFFVNFSITLTFVRMTFKNHILICLFYIFCGGFHPQIRYSKDSVMILLFPVFGFKTFNVLDIYHNVTL